MNNEESQVRDWYDIRPSNNEADKWKSWGKVDKKNIVKGKRKRNAVRYLALLGDPRKYSEILGRPDRAEWLKSYKEEIDALEEIGEFQAVKRSSVKGQVLPLKELFTTKRDGRKKVRMVVRGDFEKDNGEATFAPTAGFEVVRVMMALIAKYNLFVRSLDVKNAFLNGERKTEVYVNLPQGHKLSDKGYVWKTKRAAYGLRSSPKDWNNRLVEVLTQLGLKQCEVDPCFFKGDKLWLIAYVDDLLYCSTDKKKLDEFEKRIQEHFVRNFGTSEM